jgi:hypothetical protein
VLNETQLPAWHAGVAPEHALPLAHCPLELQLCGVLPEHCVAPGVHTPVHEPELHT